MIKYNGKNKMEKANSIRKSKVEKDFGDYEIRIDVKNLKVSARINLKLG